VAALADSVWPAEKLEQIVVKAYTAHLNQELENAYYYVAQRKGGHPSFHSFLFNATRELAVVLQATVKAKHIVQLEYLTELHNHRNVREIWYVVVTPGPNHNDVSAAEDRDGSIAKKWYQLEVKKEDVAALSDL